MVRVYVTRELAESIKSMRLQNKIISKNLAEHINKSPAYITKLEKGEIYTIDEDELKSIFRFISQDNYSFDEIIEKIYTTLRFTYSQEEIEKQVWFANFDTVRRKLPIPPGLIDEINARLHKVNKNSHYLLSRINANEALSESENNDTSIPFNTWWSRDNVPSTAQSIKIKFDEKTFYGILNKEIDISPYIFLLSMSFYLIKIEKFDETLEITDDQNKELMSQATELLNKYKFYSLAAKDALLTQAQSIEEQNNLLSSFDKENIDIVNRILGKIKFMSDSDIKNTNKNLKLFDENLDWDMGFMLKLVSFEFRSLGGLAYSKRKQLLEKINILLNEYDSLPDKHKKLETY